MSEKFNYGSVLAGCMKSLVETKEAAGYNTLRTKWILKEFDDYAKSVDLKEPRISRELVEGWRNTRVNDCERTLYAKYSTWNQLATHMNRQGFQCFVPQIPRQPKPTFTPYIFTKEEINAIFLEIDKATMVDAHMNVSLFSLPALYRTLYSTGMRVSEATSIRNEDVRIDEHCILLKKTKNKMERIVPVCESLAVVLGQYESYRNKMPIPNVAMPTSPYFIRPDGTCLNESCILKWFKKVYMRCGIPYIGNHNGPRTHDLRHTYGVHALERLVRSGMDIYTALPILSCVLGHKSIKATEQYVRLTKAMYPEMAEKCSELSLFVLPKPRLGEDWS